MVVPMAVNWDAKSVDSRVFYSVGHLVGYSVDNLVEQMAAYSAVRLAAN